MLNVAFCPLSFLSVMTQTLHSFSELQVLYEAPFRMLIVFYLWALQIQAQLPSSPARAGVWLAPFSLVAALIPGRKNDCHKDSINPPTQRQGTPLLIYRWMALLLCIL